MIAFRHLARVWLLVVGLAMGQSVQAQPDQIVSIEPVVKNGQLYIDADINLEISAELRRAAEKGVPLYFTADLEILEGRWWWFDKVLLLQQHTWRLSYNVLTQQWRVGSGDLNMPAATFEDALAYVRHIRGWSVAAIEQFDPDAEYRGHMRMRFDTSRLPRPFRIDSFNRSTWSVVTPWKGFSFSIAPPADPQ